MIILTNEQMAHAQWECELQGITLWEGLAIHAYLVAEGLADCECGNHCDDVKGRCIFCHKSL
jgi:hypothetical protein